ncbi:MAG: haloalkane dehalogenase [Candidatus Marinimicrobia bacterium]|nr:haloalkane dehalogenase [Candidatus Neomarinimicrobiota bacterium]
MAPKAISADFPFESKYVEVHGSKIHYVDEGSGDPILFLHGNPTSSYLWRNIIPYLMPHGRCIALDLIGMGKSDKPDLDYRFFDHSKYVEGFIEKLDLSNLTLVIHDWGSALGFHYAMRHENNIKGIAFMEAMLKPIKWEDFPSKYRMGFKLFRAPGIGWFMISVMNVFVTKMLPQAIVRKLTAEEKDYYGSPYKTVNSRKPIRQWPCEIPIEGKPADVYEVISSYNQKLQESEVPKLLFFATPGGIIDSKTVDWCRQNLKNLKVVDIGDGIHFIQEDNPHLIGEELAKWFQDL